MKHVLIDPSTQTAELLDPENLEGRDTTGMTMLSVADDFSWIDKTVDWTALAIVDDIAGLRARKSAAIDAKLAEAFLGGFTPSAGPLAGHTLQVRPGTDDRSNWLASQAIYSAEVASGSGATVAAEFRDAANVVVTISYADGLSTLLAMGAWGFALTKNSWTLKDQVVAAADAAAIEAVDITVGWQ